MTEAIKTYHIHPIYKEKCRIIQQKSEAALETMKNATPEERLQLLIQKRADDDVQARKLIMPATEQIKLEISGGPNHLKVKTVIFRPPGTQDNVLPVILYYHGGGFIKGSAYTHAKLVSELCIRTHSAVVLVEYTLSPQVQFPVAAEECFAALCWLRDHGAASIHIDPDHIIVAGDSAGGNLAAVITLMAKEHGMSDAIRAQVLMYPCVIFDTSKYESYQLFGGGDYGLGLREIELVKQCYLSNPTKDMQNVYASPILATDEQLQHLPPALILTCEADVLRDEGEDYATRLTDAGVPTYGMRILGAIHGYMSEDHPETPQYVMSLQMISEFIKQHHTQ
ncbi:alpha/beta hydrolase fold-domain-containing protein [Gilbertella persicaria]|uniref:alpha/beta hydrolase fold-domain-containing protein n=1 Tax=Gilbertella persicaria TaxID=101096 RepID=UPI00221F7DA6|nr:alpha/beta hydrolase fold-domain-containing protein [Gilbertella persicaria]KAI8048615.1 alpha/beta hydrolase fold-domain-containing protein [Gilbertella persicaria]